LGVVLYEMLAGSVPFEADSTMSVLYMQINEPPPPVPGATPEVQAVINRALAKNPSDRYQSCREMAVDFFQALGMNAEAETIIVSSMPTGTMSSVKQTMVGTTKPKATTQRKPLWIGAAVVGVIVIAAVFGAVKIFSNLSPASNTPETQSPNTIDPTATEAVPVTGGGLPSSDGMVEVAAGIYEVGMEPADEYHSTPTNIELTGFWVDKYQTTNAQYKKFIEATGGPAPVVSGEDDQPVRGVTFEQAVAYCSWMNKRLLTEAEWEAAGRGSGVTPQLYPWGTDPTAGGKTFDLPDQDTYAVGSQPFNVSPFGLFDMVGNVWEWVGEPYNTVQDGYRILRGGRFGLPQDLAYRLVIAPDDTRYIKFAGFRCASDNVK
jgi:formylglycine-generating enzyme required for sulfatase activity